MKASPVNQLCSGIIPERSLFPNAVVQRTDILKQFKLDKNKKIFLILAAIFLIIVILVSIDIARRTTFPGSKGNLEQRLLEDDRSSNTQEK